MSETICKFYLQGNCRFGNNCKFSHAVNKNNSFSRFTDPNRFSYVNPEEKLKQKVKQKVGSADSITEIIINDFRNWLPSKVWPFSCYSVNNLENIFPELNDLSMDEARFAYLNAMETGSIDQHIQEITAAGRKAEEFIASVAKANKQELLMLIQQKVGSESNSMDNSMSENIFAIGKTSSSYATSGSTAQNAFATNPAYPNVFPSSHQTSNIFQEKSENIFATGNNSFGSFGSHNAGQNIFATQNSQPQNPFMTKVSNDMPFGGSAFGNAHDQPPNGSAVTNTSFVQSSSIFENSSYSTNSKNEDSKTSVVNSPMSAPEPSLKLDYNPFSNSSSVSNTKTYSEDTSRLPKLSERDLLQYKNPMFEWGLIPECPPPPELCK